MTLLNFEQLGPENLHVPFFAELIKDMLEHTVLIQIHISSDKIFPIFPRKHMLWVLIRSTSATYVFIENKINTGTFWLEKVPYLVLWIQICSVILPLYA